MAKLHELLAAEKTPTGAWNQLYEDTLKKFKNPSHFFLGHSKSLKMIVDSPENDATQDQNRDEKPVTTTVAETLDYALDLFAKSEDLQYQKNKTNTMAAGTVMWRGAPLLLDMPVDELLGLEARLVRLRQLFAEIPTLDATKAWIRSPLDNVWQLQYPEETVKTEKVVVPVIMAPATDKHPAQVQAVGKDNVVGKFTLMKRSGEATAQQKADMLKIVDELLVETKQARMRANETEAVREQIGQRIVAILLEPLENLEG
jgi:hypothetical protein